VETLKIIQTRVSPENFNYKFVELCLTCKSTIVWTIVYGVEHETAISVEAYLALVSMGLRFFGYFLALKVSVE
jgi:hypothetical protein